MVKFHKRFPSGASILRYFHVLQILSQRVAHERLMRMCFLDYDREMALIGRAHRARKR